MFGNSKLYRLVAHSDILDPETGKYLPIEADSPAVEVITAPVTGLEFDDMVTMAEGMRDGDIKTESAVMVTGGEIIVEECRIFMGATVSEWRQSVQHGAFVTIPPAFEEL